MKKSRYIAQLKDKAEERKKEESIIFDRRRVTLLPFLGIPSHAYLRSSDCSPRHSCLLRQWVTRHPGHTERFFRPTVQEEEGAGG